MVNLSVGSIISEGFKLGLKNLPSLIGAIFLWVITIWIPYLNVGTTIGVMAIVVAMSKGDMISPTEIFNGKYRRYMGEFFLLVGFMYVGIIMGYIFIIIPGIVISIAWGQAIYLMIDKGLSPTEALKTSNDITYGSKWTIFGGIFLLAIILYVVGFVVAGIGSLISEGVSRVLGIIAFIVLYPVLIGAQAHIYSELVKQID